METSLRTEGPVEISDRHFNNWLSLYQDSLNGLTVPLYSPEGATSPAEVSFTMKQKLFQKQYGTKLQFFSKLENGEFNKYLKATSEKS